jgi:hypothetical protein
MGLDGVLRLILAGEKDEAISTLAHIRAGAASASDDFQRTRSLRWIAELLIRLGETSTALAIARDISVRNESGNSSNPADMAEWVTDLLRRLSEALSADAPNAAAIEVAEAAMHAAERIVEEATRMRAESRAIRTYTVIGQHDRALEHWYQDLPAAYASGRPRLFELLGAGAGALAAHDQGATLWTIYQDMNA